MEIIAHGAATPRTQWNRTRSGNWSGAPPHPGTVYEARARAQMSGPPRYSDGALPTELWIGVARYVTRGRDVVALAGTSRLFRQIATRRANVRQVASAWAQSDRIGNDWLELVRYAHRLEDKDGHGRTALHFAAGRGREAAAAALIAAGADMNARDQNDETALYCAAGRGCEASVAALIAAGADVNARNVDGGTVLHSAVRKGHEAIAAALRAAGATE